MLLEGLGGRRPFTESVVHRDAHPSGVAAADGEPLARRRTALVGQVGDEWGDLFDRQPVGEPRRPRDAAEVVARGPRRRAR